MHSDRKRRASRERVDELCDPCSISTGSPTSCSARAVVLTENTLTPLRLDADSNVAACSPPFRALKRDVLVVATAHWRSASPGGLGGFYVPRTGARGDALVSRCAAPVAKMERAPPSRESVEDDLRKQKLVDDGDQPETNPEERALLFARVAWLERNGHLTVDNYNGVHFIYGVESDLDDAEERRRNLRAKAFPN
jgi:hypothetical protein